MKEKIKNSATMRFICVFFVAVFVVATFLSCSTINLRIRHKYFLYIFNDSQQMFEKSNMYIMFENEKRFQEIYSQESGSVNRGNYNYDKKNNVVYMTYDASVLNNNLKNINNLIEKENNLAIKSALQALAKSLQENYTEITKFENYLIKNEHITAIRIQKNNESLTTIEGYYVIPSGNSSSNIALFEKGKVFAKNTTNEDVYDKLLGTYRIQGNYVELQFVDDNGNPRGTPQKYLFAQIAFKINIIDDYGKIENGKFVIVNENVKIGILAKAFYA